MWTILFSFYSRIDDVDSDDEDEQLKAVNTNRDNMLHPFTSDTSSCLADLKLSRHFQRPYNLWYAIRINSIPSEPVKCLEVQSYVNSTATVELLLKNPQKEDLNLDVIIDGFNLYGEVSVTVKPYSSGVYQLRYSPIVTGKSKARY